MIVGASAPAAAAAPYPFRHRAGGRGVPGVTDIIGDLELRAKPPRTEATRRKGVVGSIVHDAIDERLSRDSTAPIASDEARGYFRSWEAWMETVAPSLVRVVATETTIRSETAPLYAGTVDAVLELRSGLWVLDWKVRPYVKGDDLQAATYAAHVGKDLKAPVRCGIVSLRPDGSAATLREVDAALVPELIATFRCAAHVWWFRYDRGWRPKEGDKW